MPGTLHEGLVALFRDDPRLALDLATAIYEAPLPTGTGKVLDRHNELEVDATELLKVHPLRADLALVIDDPTDPRGGAVIIIEAQSRHDPDKRWTLPLYQALLAARHRRPAWVVVVALHPEVSRELAAWAVGPPPQVDALVLDRNNVPRITDPKVAERRPALAALSAVLHGLAGDHEVVAVALEAVRRLDEPRRSRYTGTILAALSPARRRVYLEKFHMEMEEEYVKFLDIERQSGTYHRGHEEGREEALAENRGQLIELIVTVLELRGLGPSASQLEAIRGCTDDERVARWGRRVREVASVDELLAAS